MDDNDHLCVPNLSGYCLKKRHILQLCQLNGQSNQTGSAATSVSNFSTLNPPSTCTCLSHVLITPDTRGTKKLPNFNLKFLLIWQVSDSELTRHDGINDLRTRLHDAAVKKHHCGTALLKEMHT